MPDVRAALRKRGIRPDSAAGRRFRAAVVALHGDEAGTDEGSSDDHATTAAAALLELAAAGHGPELSDYLTPDPDTEASAWTVVCYEVGDVSPSAIRDFSAPEAALATLAACDDPDHAAAELLCSTEDGLRWTALTRAGQRTAFQLPTLETSSPGEPGAIDREQALASWRRRIRSWAQADEDRWSLDAPDPVRSLAALHRRLDAIDDRLDAIARTIAALADLVTTTTTTEDHRPGGLPRPVEDDDA